MEREGTFVAANADNLEELTKLPAELSRLSTPFKMMQARLASEPAIAREAAMHASGDVLAKLNTAMERTPAASNWKSYETNSDEFRRAIVREGIRIRGVRSIPAYTNKRHKAAQSES